ncbi:hypothetical protein D3C87_2154920 [compost metagenome]
MHQLAKTLTRVGSPVSDAVSNPGTSSPSTGGRANWGTGLSISTERTRLESRSMEKANTETSATSRISGRANST